MTTKDEILEQQVTAYPRYVVKHEGPNRAARRATRHKEHAGRKHPRGWRRFLRQKRKAGRRARGVTLGQRRKR